MVWELASGSLIESDSHESAAIVGEILIFKLVFAMMAIPPPRILFLSCLNMVKSSGMAKESRGPAALCSQDSVMAMKSRLSSTIRSQISVACAIRDLAFISPPLSRWFDG